MRGKRFAGLVLSLLAVFGWGALGNDAFAQAPPPAAPYVTVDVPFSFTIYNTTFPAGNYRIRELAQNPWEFQIETAKGDYRAVFEAEPSVMSAPASPTQIDFDLLNGQYFLSRIWLQGNELGYSVYKSNLERRLLKGKVMPEKKSVVATLAK